MTRFLYPPYLVSKIVVSRSFIYTVLAFSVVPRVLAEEECTRNIFGETRCSDVLPATTRLAIGVGLIVFCSLCLGIWAFVDRRRKQRAERAVDTLPPYAVDQSQIYGPTTYNFPAPPAPALSGPYVEPPMTYAVPAGAPRTDYGAQMAPMAYAGQQPLQYPALAYPFVGYSSQQAPPIPARPVFNPDQKIQAEEV